MKIRALTDISTDEVTIAAGDVGDLDNDRAATMIATGCAVAIDEDAQ